MNKFETQSKQSKHSKQTDHFHTLIAASAYFIILLAIVLSVVRNHTYATESSKSNSFVNFAKSNNGKIVLIVSWIAGPVLALLSLKRVTKMFVKVHPI